MKCYYFFTKQKQNKNIAYSSVNMNYNLAFTLVAQTENKNTRADKQK